MHNLIPGNIVALKRSPHSVPIGLGLSDWRFLHAAEIGREVVLSDQPQRWMAYDVAFGLIRLRCLDVSEPVSESRVWLRGDEDIPYLDADRDAAGTHWWVVEDPTTGHVSLGTSGPHKYLSGKIHEGIAYMKEVSPTIPPPPGPSFPLWEVVVL